MSSWCQSIDNGFYLNSITRNLKQERFSVLFSVARRYPHEGVEIAVLGVGMGFGGGGGLGCSRALDYYATALHARGNVTLFPYTQYSNRVGETFCILF